MSGDDEGDNSRQSDVVLREARVTAFVSSHQWPNKHPNVMVIPNDHYESIFELPDDVALDVHRASRTIATALIEAFGCDGISLRQNNRPAGGQEVAHYHLHVTPSYRGDGGAPSSTGKTPMDAAERARDAMGLRDRCKG